jgi:hypothetical protein
MISSPKPGEPLSVPSPPSKQEMMGSVKTFFLLTFAVTWSCWIAIVMVPIPAHTIAQAVLLFVGIFSPSLVALSLTGWTKGADGVRLVLARMFQWEVPGRWYLFALGYTLSIKLFVTLISCGLRRVAPVWERSAVHHPICDSYFNSCPIRRGGWLARLRTPTPGSAHGTGMGEYCSGSNLGLLAPTFILSFWK